VGVLPATTYLKVPAGAVVHITIDQQDSPSGLRNPYFSLVRGTVNDEMTVNGKVVQAIDPTTPAHTFTVPDLGSVFPLKASPGVQLKTSSSSTSSFLTRRDSSAGSASCRVAPAHSMGTAARCRRSATWPASSRWADR